MRCFTAIPVSEATREQVGALIETLQRGVRGRISWVAQKNLHFTLHFFGEIRSDQADALAAAMEPAVSGLAPFTMAYGDVGAFPNLRRPSVIWLGLRHGAEEIEALKIALDHAIETTGIPFDRKRFHPHLTLGRVRDARIHFGDTQAEITSNDTASEVILMESTLAPNGSIYSPYRRLSFGVAARG